MVRCARRSACSATTKPNVRWPRRRLPTRRCDRPGRRRDEVGRAAEPPATVSSRARPQCRSDHRGVRVRSTNLLWRRVFRRTAKAATPHAGPVRRAGGWQVPPAAWRARPSDKEPRPASTQNTPRSDSVATGAAVFLRKQQSEYPGIGQRLPQPAGHRPRVCVAHFAGPGWSGTRRGTARAASTPNLVRPDRAAVSSCRHHQRPYDGMPWPR